MAAMSDYLRGQVLTHIFRTSSFTKPSTLAIALLTTAADADDTGQFSTGTGNEVANSGSYARQTLDPDNANWAAISSGATNNLADITFPTASGNWGTIVAIAITDDATYDSGNLLFYGTLSVSKTVTSGDTFTIPATDLVASLS